MRTSSHGHMSEFDSSVEEWTAYTERLDSYPIANDVTSEDKKQAILLSVCGPSTYRLIRNLVAPQLPKSKSFADLVKLVKEHYHPRPSTLVMQFRFNSCYQQQGEKLASFVARMRQLTEFCEFGGTLDEMLRDRLVCGVMDERIQRRLLTEVSLTFDKAYKIAQACESADENSKVLRPNTSTLTMEVHATQQVGQSQESDRRPPSTDCYRCGGKHALAKCRFRNVDCCHCGKKGHTARVCRSKRTQNCRTLDADRTFNSSGRTRRTLCRKPRKRKRCRTMRRP